MKMKKFFLGYTSALLLTLVCVTILNIIVDPLFQYHKPWLGLSPVITNERYHNPGIAKSFEFENVLIGNSLSENFLISDLNVALDGETAKLTYSGSHPLDWQYTLNILEGRIPTPQQILIQLDPYVFSGSVTELKHEMPIYLYDNNLVNDVNYLLNIEILQMFTLKTIKDNVFHSVPDYNKIYTYDNLEFGKKFILSNVERTELSQEVIDVDSYVRLALENVRLLTRYIEKMRDTEFVFFCSPFSVLFWDNAIRSNTYKAVKESYYQTIRYLLSFENVTVFFWNDDEMLGIISNLENYRDEAHYDGGVCKNICGRIKNGNGIIDNGNYQEQLNVFFSYIEKYDYDLIWDSSTLR